MIINFQISSFFYLAILFFACSSEKGLTDSRDGQTYATKEMKDGKTWMTENLNYSSPDSWCFRESTENCTKFGRLYSWEAAKIACPDGWHLPTDEEWWNLTSFYGKAYSTFFGKAHNATFQREKKNNNHGAGKEALKLLQVGGAGGLELQFSGYRFANGTFYTDDNVGMYWTSSAYKSSGTGWYYFIRDGGGLARNFGREVGLARSCRCVKDDE